MSSQSTIMTARRGGVRVTVTVTAGIVIIGVALLLTIRPGWVRDVAVTLAGTRFGWLIGALAAQAISIGALARQQRRLLTASGDRPLPVASVLATTYGGSALSLSLPIVGKAAAAVYSYRRFTTRGLEPATVGWALAMSALHLIIAFLLVSTIGALAAASPGAIMASILTTAAIVVAVMAGLIALRKARFHGRVNTAIDLTFARLHRVSGRPWPRTRRRVHAAVQMVATTRLGARNTVAVMAWSLLNMVGALTAFSLSVLAVGGTATWPAITLTWAAAFGAGQLGLTPGGIGIVDTALTVGLVTAGIPTATAIAATLIYRIISFWITAAVGGIAFALTTRTSTHGIRSLPDVNGPVSPTG